MSTRTLFGAGAALIAVLVLGAAAIGVLHNPGAAAATDLPEDEAFWQVPPPSPGPTGPRPGGPGMGPERMRQRHDAFVNRLAANLGVTPDQLRQAMQKTRVDLINQAVQEGRLSREQADQIIQRINSGQRPGSGPEGPGRGPKWGHGLRGQALTAAAGALGMSADQLRGELRSGKSVAEVAQARNVSREDAKNRILTAVRAEVDAAVARGALPADRARQITDRITANIDPLLDLKPGARGGPPR